ncbi:MULTISPECIES: hypothetical protein [unclassified Halomonas]|uniref:hypothetical protein n=1 Tax=unclassified Halomonas TaxID=2609666 RepID=UPI0007D8E442|nr:MULTISPECIES: hypothetical protein [unclassified Halomonas]MBT2784831.1 hypothetical protein [Halomonas sp. ISL-106]MBT2796525.1 hypothetical protein [Halomonas sp. ISL-104]OAL59769.1 hypothetical protein A6R74_00385 [Halomonas sp. ALS9]
MKIKRFTYSLRQHPGGGTYLQFDIRLQNHRAKIGLTPDDTFELWITRAEMPTVVADMVDERTWDGHRKTILAMLANHFQTPFY